jgi:hypothetical protein
MKLKPLIFLIILLSAGCVEDNAHICPDGSRVSDPGECPTTTTPSTITYATTSSIKSATSTTTTAEETTTKITLEGVECYEDADCGVNGTETVKNYTCLRGDIQRQYIRYRCENPGMESAKCAGEEESELIKACGDEGVCVEDEPYCKSLEKVGEYNLRGRTINLIPETERHAGWEYDTVKLYGGYYSHYRGYSFRLNYPITTPVGVFLQVRKPDGSETDFYCTESQNTKVDDMIVGLDYISTQEPCVGIWIYSKGK